MQKLSTKGQRAERRANSEEDEKDDMRKSMCGKKETSLLKR